MNMESCNAVQTRQIPINVPYNIDDLGITQTYLQEAIAAVLYHNGVLPLKEARKLVGQSRREFEENTLPKFGYTTLDNCPDNTSIELRSVI